MALQCRELTTIRVSVCGLMCRVSLRVGVFPSKGPTRRWWCHILGMSPTDRLYLDLNMHRSQVVEEGGS